MMESSGFANHNQETSHVLQEDLSALLKVSSSLASTLDLTAVLQIAIESTVEVLRVETGAIYTLENEILYLGATTPPLPAEFPDALRFGQLEDHPHIKTAIETKSPVYLDDAHAAQLSPAEKTVVDARGLVSLLFFPLMLKERPIGAFIVGTTGHKHQFTSKEIDLCNILSCQASLAVANAQLYQKAQQAILHLTQAYDATLAGWSRMLDMRDHATDEHTRRVAETVITLAGQMGIPESDWGHLWRGALLHDIGKMGLPDAILQKPDVLSDSERDIMRTHPQLAYQLLSQIDFLTPAIDIPYCHHEKWDGTGYPRNLAGEEIPLAARLFAVVDVFDALTSDRPYRKAWTREKAVRYIQEQSGKHFSPEVVKAFLEMLGE